MTNSKNKTEYLNDPTDDYLEVKEMNAEDNYYQWESEFPNTTAVTEYVAELERKLKSKNDGLKEVISTMDNGHLDFYKKKLKAILNL